MKIQKSSIKPNPIYIKINKYMYSLLVSSIALVSALIVAVLRWLNTDVLTTFDVLYPIFALITLIYLIYTIATIRKRNLIDFIVAGILFISVLVITIQCFLHIYRPDTGNYYHELYYDFPWTLGFGTYDLVSLETMKYEFSGTVNLFDPTLISSLICFIVSIVMYIFEKKKEAKI